MRPWHVLAAAACIFLLACSRPMERGPAGKYETRHPSAQDRVAVLILDEDGKGSLSFNGDNAPLKWTAKTRGEVWLHTRDGGVIEARQKDFGLEMSLPGVGAMAFTRIE
ncbi:MAG: hypothetical protein JW718_04920 [Desulfovibrionaceae bacterium]|nr:hypothetical protein [Desulfovibrionaceae bacterium]